MPSSNIELLIPPTVDRTIAASQSLVHDKVVASDQLRESNSFKNGKPLGNNKNFRANFLHP
jgi:hypothetical protein